MTKNLDNDGLRSIVESYDIFYIDLWGVVHNGITLHKNAIKALEEITQANKDYVLLTNAPRPNKTVNSISFRNVNILSRFKGFKINSSNSFVTGTSLFKVTSCLLIKAFSLLSSKACLLFGCLIVEAFSKRFSNEPN